MKAFHSGREAEEFLSPRLSRKRIESIPLSEVERKMLYFTESGWTLPDIVKVNEDFDREYDQDEYEHKIAKLLRKADQRIRKAHVTITTNGGPQSVFLNEKTTTFWY